MEEQGKFLTPNPSHRPLSSWSAATTSTTNSDSSNLALMSPKLTINRRYVDRNVLKRLHQEDSSISKKSKRDQNSFSSNVSRSTKRLIARLYKKYVSESILVSENTS